MEGIKSEVQDGSVAVWKMFNAPLTALFQNLDHAEEGLDTLMTSIINSKSDFSELLVSQQSELQSQYVAFNKWLLGRLFYILSVKKFERIHRTSIDAQLKILTVLFVNRAAFYREIYREYIVAFQILIDHYYKIDYEADYTKNLEFEILVPDKVNMPAADLDLTSLKIVVTDLNVCKTMIKCIMEIFCQTFMSVRDLQNFSEDDKIFNNMLYILEYFDYDLKSSVIEFFTKIFNHFGLSSNLICTHHFFVLIESLTSQMSMVKCENINQYYQIDIVNGQLVQLFNSLQSLGLSSDPNLNIMILNICKFILSIDRYRDEECSENNRNISFFTYELKKCCTKLVEKVFSADIVSVFNEVNTKEYISEMPMFIVSKFIAEVKEIMKINQRSIIDFYERSDLFQNTLSLLMSTLENAHNADLFIVNNHLETCITILNIFQNFRIEFNHYEQQRFEIFDNVFFLKSGISKNIEKAMKIPSLRFIPRDKAVLIIKNVIDIIKKTLNTVQKPLEVVFICMEIVMLLLTLSVDLVSKDLEVLLQFECFILSDNVELCYSSELLSSNSDRKIHLHTLHILLIQNLCLGSLLKNERNRKIMDLINSFDLNNEEMYTEIIQCSPLLMLNQTLPPHKLLTDYMYPALLSNNKTFIQELIIILPVIVCTLFGHYAIIQSEEMRNCKDYEHKLSSIDGLHLNFICLHCYNSNCNPKNVQHQLNNNKIMIMLQKSHLIYDKQNDFLEKLRSIFEKFLDVKILSTLPVPMVSKLIFTFARHSIMTLSTIESIITAKNLVHFLDMFRPFVTNVLNDSRLDDTFKDTILNTSINILFQTTRLSLVTNDFQLQDTCLKAIRQFGMGPYDKIILPSMKLLVHFVMHYNCPYGSKAAFYIKDICEYHKISPNKVYHRYKKDLCRIMMWLIADNYLLGQGFAPSISKIIRAFGYCGYKEFVSKDIHHALPYIIPAIAKSEKLKPIIPEIAALVHCNSAKFVDERFPHIYTYIYINEPADISCICFKYIEDITKESLNGLIKKHSRVILTELLLQYCSDPEKVIKACRWLSNMDPKFSPSSPDLSIRLTQVADFIQPKFLGVLAYFDNKLVHTKIAISVKRKALQSFPHLLNLMGCKHLTPLRFKILATLRTALTLMKEFPELNADAWDSFIRNIDTIVLGSLLTTIFVSLLPLIPYATAKINDIFEYLIVSNENLLSNHIIDLFFLEETSVNHKVKSIVAKHLSKKIPELFIEKLKWYMRYLNHDTVEMKIYALKYLQKIIKNHRIDLDQSIFNCRHINPSIVELIDILITGCRDNDNQLADWSGRCLGQLGALQPSLLPRRPSPVQNSSPFAFNIQEPCFAKMALIELTRAFQYGKHTKDMDCYSLAIQEILNTFNISPNGENKELWESFPDHMHQIMAPLLSSRYTLAFQLKVVKLSPIFGSKHGATFSEWAFSWACQLIPLIDNNSTQYLLKMVHPALKKDSRTLVLFLPYIVLHTILSNNDTAIIRDEIMAIIQLKSFGSKITNKIESPKLRIMRSVNLIPVMTPLIIEEGTHMKCCKMIYNLFDFLYRWIYEWCHINKNATSDSKYIKLDSFINNFCKLTIAKGNFLCGELERALLYLEMYMEESTERIQEQLSFLAEIYAILNEPDAVSGILSMKQTEPSLSELILAHEVTGQLQDAATCYEKYAQEGDINSERLQGMVEIYLGLDQPFTALQLLQGADEMDLGDEAMAAEPFWRLGMFEDLDKLLQQPEVCNDDRWGVRIGHCLLTLRGGMREPLEDKLKSARYALMRRLDESTVYTSSEESIYSRVYSSAVGLHMITEIEHIEDVVYKIKNLNDDDANCASLVNDLIEDWNLRFKLVQSSASTVEPILRLRRILLEQSKELLYITHPQTASILDMYIGKLWLQSAKFARKAAIFQQAYIYILNGEKYTPKELFIEKAKLYWMRGQQEPAFCTLKRGLEEHFPDVSQLSPLDRKLCAKAKLLIAVYNDETTNVEMDVNITHYMEAVEVYRQWEKSLVCLGGYYERLYAASSEIKKYTAEGLSIKARALECYGRALQHGHSMVYQSMPRMLSIWLDFEVPEKNNNPAKVTLSQICKLIEKFVEVLPLHLFLTAFSQIISRICHPYIEVYNQLKLIIIKLIIAYPQQSLWMMMCVIKSSYPKRIRRCQEILNDPRLKEHSIKTFINDFKLLAEKLIELCNKPILDNIHSTYVTKLVCALPKLLASDNFSQIVIPHEKFVKMVLPFSSSNKDSSFNYNPFPSLVYISGIEDKITIIPSLQKPRQVTLKGSDGKKYIIMLKPKDDLRIDFRLMEFNAVVNRYLQENSDARERRLYIRTYTVLPLNEECGLIQWVPNLVGFRSILIQIYKNKGIYTSPRELKQLQCANEEPLSKKRAIFETKLIPKHPPVFGEWFRYTFPDPHSWYQARSAYIRTTAVMSMVGYILGLGDRHGENILFDATNGDTVHVDFNCLFNKGEDFGFPERVPFRLTHNMQAAMGPLGHEGMFRKCSEITMKVLRSQTTTLMSVIRPFVYDPLVGNQRLADNNVGERTNQCALNNLTNIEQRLGGTVRTKGKQFFSSSLSLSAEGQTNHLILEAISVVNLCQMYIGWGPYL